MSNQSGEGSILANLRFLKSSKAPVKAATQTPDAPQPLSGAIRVLGERSEHLRTRCETVLTSFGTLRSAADEVEGLFQEFGAIATELQERSNTLEETRTALASEIKAKHDQIEENAILRANISRVESELELLSTGHANGERRREALEEYLRAAQIDLKDKAETLKTIETERTAVMARAQQLSNEGVRLTQKLKETEAALDEARGGRRAAEDKYQFETQERLKLAEGNKELTDMYTLEKKNFLETSSLLEKSKYRTSEIEAQLATANAEADSLRAALRTSESRRETDEVGFILKIETLGSRLELTEQLLTRAREEAHRLGEEQFLHGETNRRLQQSQAEAEELRVKLERASKHAADLERSRDATTVRANDLVNELREKRALNEQAAERIASLQKLSTALQAEKDNDIKKLKEQIKQLTEALAKEHAAREYAEGSLQAARRDRVQLQNTIMQIDNGRADKSGLSVIDVTQASTKDLKDLQSKLEDERKDVVENIPRPQGVL